MHLKEERIIEIVNAFGGKKILVVGDIMIDEYLSGRVTRISPEAPVPVIEIQEEVTRFGGAANVALNIKELGCTAILAGVTGNDRHGEIFSELMKEYDIDGSAVIRSGDRPTTVKTRIIGDSQHIARADREMVKYLDPDEEKLLTEKIDNQLARVQAVILEDYNKGVLNKELIQTIIGKCNQNNLPVMVDPKFDNFMQYKNVTFFKPNIKEAQQALARHFKDDTDVEQAGFQLLRELNCESVLLTRGSRGLSLFEKDRVTHIPTQARKVADVSGAGDTVISTFTAAYTAGADKREAAILANLAAGIVVEEVGIIPVSRGKLLAAAKH